MADEVDKADSAIQLALDEMMYRHSARVKEEALFNALGEKVCSDCGIEIPIKRACIEGVTRCIDCQREEERYQRLYYIRSDS